MWPAMSPPPMSSPTPHPASRSRSRCPRQRRQLLRPGPPVPPDQRGAPAMTETGGRTIGAKGWYMQAPRAADRVQLTVGPPAQLVPVQAHRTLAAEVTANLRQAIVSGSLSPEHELSPEPETARLLG